MLAVTGYRSRIVEELHHLLPEDEHIVRIGDDKPPICDRYLLCAGMIQRKLIGDQTSAEIGESLHVNLIRPIELCEQILAENDKARICVMGSESGFAWSYDGTYAASKAALHKYVETKKLSPDQQLVCVAPSIVADCGMTTCRTDADNLARRKEINPKKRFLTALEVARLVHYLLYVDQGYTTGIVIRVNGGEHTIGRG